MCDKNFDEIVNEELKQLDELSSAAGSAIGSMVGMAVGMAVGGPVGAAAGSVVGGTIAKAAVPENEEDIKMYQDSIQTAKKFIDKAKKKYQAKIDKAESPETKKKYKEKMNKAVGKWEAAMNADKEELAKIRKRIQKRKAKKK